ncbi:MAG: VanW family protein [Thermomicrobiales bacterium]
MAQRTTAQSGSGQGFGDAIRDALSSRRSGRPSGDKGSPGFSTEELRARLVAVLPRLGLVLTALVLAAVLGLLVFRVAFSDRIYPAVIVGDVPVGGLTVQEAENRLNQRATELENGTITFTYQGMTWTPKLSELGATVDVSSSLDKAEKLGRTGDVQSRLAFTGDLIRSDQTVPLRTTINTDTLDAWFDQVDASINHRAVDAAIVIDNGTAKITPDATGTIVDRPTASAQIMNALQRLEPVNVELPTLVEQPQIRAGDLQARYSELQTALSKPISVELEGNSWKISPSDLTQYLTIKTSYVDGASHVDLALDTDSLASSLNEQFASQVNREPVNATVAWNEGVGLVATNPSIDGLTLKPAEFAEAVSQSFLGDNKTIEMPVIVTKPEIDANNLDALGITSQLSTGDSDYSNGSPDRDNNIEVGIRLLNGTLVKPGADFSFNGAIGEITADKGYTEAGVIVAERVGRDIGGGICQVSTTTFRAALLGGFPIGDWWPHAYRLAGYEADGWGPGFDASILQEGSDPQYWGDFTFTNNTSGWLLVEAWTEYPKAYVRIYGTDDGRKVEISKATIGEPITDHPDVEVVDDTLPAGTIKQTEYPQDGVDVSFERIVTDQNGNVMDDRVFDSPYGGRGNVYTVSPDMAGKSPASTGNS